MTPKDTIAAFDFDGTLTTRDTLIDFFCFVHGRRKTLLTLLRFAPLIILMKLGLADNHSTKERVFGALFKGMPYATFKRYGELYAERISHITKASTLSQAKEYISLKNRAIIISASIDEWIRPWALKEGFCEVLSTRIETDAAGNLTGRFLTPNCYGAEKVKRLQEYAPHRENYTLYAYGNGEGDKELLEAADHKTRCSSHSSHKEAGLLGLCVFAYCMLIGLQGFDMCDEGWVMTGYQEFFDDPSSVEYQFLYYATLLVGACWYKVFGWMGFYGFRILASILFALTAVNVYHTLKDHVSKWGIALGIAICLALWDSGMYVFHHDHMCMLLTSLSCLLISKALTKDRCALMVGAGVAVGINVFVRLPNITMCALLLALIPMLTLIKCWWKHALAAIGGFVIGCALMVGIMAMLGHTETFLGAIDLMQKVSDDPLSTHDWGSMLSTYATNYFAIAKWTFLVVFFALGAHFALQRRYRLHAGFICFGIIGICYLAPQMMLAYGCSTAVCLAVFIKQRQDKALMCIAALALIWAHFMPIGSDWGIANTGVACNWLMIPLATGLWQKYGKARTIRWAGIIVCSILLMQGAHLIYNNGYFDHGSRRVKTYRIDHPRATVYTTKRNKELLDPLLKELEKHVQPGDYLFQYMKCPTLHYLTQTRPYLNNSWVWASTPLLITSAIEEREAQKSPLPVVVREKSAIGTWYEYDPTWNDNHAENTYEHKNEKITIIQQFLERHNYQLVWENEIFQILIPNDSLEIRK